MKVSHNQEIDYELKSMVEHLRHIRAVKNITMGRVKVDHVG